MLEAAAAAAAAYVKNGSWYTPLAAINLFWCLDGWKGKILQSKTRKDEDKEGQRGCSKKEIRKGTGLVGILRKIC